MGGACAGEPSQLELPLVLRIRVLSYVLKPQWLLSSALPPCSVQDPVWEVGGRARGTAVSGNGERKGDSLPFGVPVRGSIGAALKLGGGQGQPWVPNGPVKPLGGIYTDVYIWPAMDSTDTVKLLPS